MKGFLFPVIYKALSEILAISHGRLKVHLECNTVVVDIGMWGKSTTCIVKQDRLVGEILTSIIVL